MLQVISQGYEVMIKYEDIHEVSLESKWLETARGLYKETLHWGREPFTLSDSETVDRLLQGAIDTHTHPGPDPYVFRPLDATDIGIQACQMGMGAGQLQTL